jgi:uncharacterized protein YjbI with pentapeptide repeats
MKEIRNLQGEVLASGSTLHEALTTARERRVPLIAADFRGQNLRGADFRALNLTNACFEHADISGADFQEAFLIGAHFYRANARHARFHSAYAVCAVFIYANLEYAVFEHAHLGQAAFFRANACDAQFQHASLLRADFHASYLDRAAFDGATVDHACFAGAINARLDGALCDGLPVTGCPVEVYGLPLAVRAYEGGVATIGCQTRAIRTWLRLTPRAIERVYPEHSEFTRRYRSALRALFKLPCRTPRRSIAARSLISSSSLECNDQEIG